jgi:hypothetical protein
VQSLAIGARPAAPLLKLKLQWQQNWHHGRMDVLPSPSRAYRHKALDATTMLQRYNSGGEIDSIDLRCLEDACRPLLCRERSLKNKVPASFRAPKHQASHDT